MRTNPHKTRVHAEDLPVCVMLPKGSYSTLPVDSLVLTQTTEITFLKNGLTSTRFTRRLLRKSQYVQKILAGQQWCQERSKLGTVPPEVFGTYWTYRVQSVYEIVVWVGKPIFAWRLVVQIAPFAADLYEFRERGRIPHFKCARFDLIADGPHVSHQRPESITELRQNLNIEALCAKNDSVTSPSSRPSSGRKPHFLYPKGAGNSSAAVASMSTNRKAARVAIGRNLLYSSSLYRWF